MALDATVGSASADSYGTLAEAEAYFAARDGAWAGEDTAKEMALRKAASFLDNAYRGKWKGQKATGLQALAWPRGWVVDSDGYAVAADEIPVAIKNAQFEAAKLIASGTALETTIGRAVKSEKVGSLAVVYMDSAAMQEQHPQVTNWLSDLVTGNATFGASVGTGRVVRG